MSQSAPPMPDTSIHKADHILSAFDSILTGLIANLEPRFDHIAAHLRAAVTEIRAERKKEGGATHG